MPKALRPHAATYDFLDRGGQVAGSDAMELAVRPGGWLVTSRLELSSPEQLTTDIEWHLEPDLTTHVLYMSSIDHWGEEHLLELAVTGNGLLASRSGPGGPTQVEMGWGPEVQLDHVAACFTTILLARLQLRVAEARPVTTVYIDAEDLLPDPLEQEYVRVGDTTVERLVPSTGSRARIEVDEGGLVLGYEGLFAVQPGWRYADAPAARPTK